MAMCGLLVFILLVTANIDGGYSQTTPDPLCIYDEYGNVVMCKRFDRSLNKKRFSVDGGYSQTTPDPHCIYDEYGNVVMCKRFDRSLNKKRFSVDGGYSQTTPDPLCIYDEYGNVVMCKRFDRSLNKKRFSVDGGYSQPTRDPLCTYDADGNMVMCETSRRSLNKKRFSGRIVGGDNAEILKHPYMLAFEALGKLNCGATIIGSRWAVTAGHCIGTTFLPFLFQLRALTNNLERGGVTFRVSEAFSHPEYDDNDDSQENDIALLRVTESFFETDSRLAAINLPQPDEELPAGTMVTVIGWGHTKENGSKSDHLRSVKVPITSFEHCNSKFDGKLNSALMICAGTEQGGKDACQADSGGPLVFDNKLYGVVSFGRGCGKKDIPGVYTKVSTYREWIKEMTGV